MTIEGPVKQQLQSEIPEVIYLYELYHRGSTEAPLRLVRGQENLEVDGNTYFASTVFHESISTSAEQEVDRVRIMVGNGPVDENILPATFGNQYWLSAFLSGNDIRGKEGKILLVAPDALDDPAEVFRGIIAKVAHGSKVIQITAVSLLDLHPLLDPSKLHLRTCVNRFPTPPGTVTPYCRYDPATVSENLMDPETGQPFQVCGKTIEECEARGNSANFRGWESTPRLFRSVV